MADVEDDPLAIIDESFASIIDESFASPPFRGDNDGKEAGAKADRAKSYQSPATAAPRTSVSAAYRALPAAPNKPKQNTGKAAPVTTSGAAKRPQRAILSPSPPLSPSAPNTLDMAISQRPSILSPSPPSSPRMFGGATYRALPGVPTKPNNHTRSAAPVTSSGRPPYTWSLTLSQAEAQDVFDRCFNALYGPAQGGVMDQDYSSKEKAIQTSDFKKEVEQEFEEYWGGPLPKRFWREHKRPTAASKGEVALAALDAFILSLPSRHPGEDIKKKLIELSKLIRGAEVLKQKAELLRKMSQRDKPVVKTEDGEPDNAHQSDQKAKKTRVR
ncbi:uncharacterized protein LOC62_02G002752 [Vanrija pseudolonga]|uniref:Uncharacterized protein n=1 Tax=Vanrija pseudolonga TaxID=143232 RepID=A0AAF0Y6M8_9TREE|nr:hypothetical protein LOC62_02G002752 [Vanrija pseudolonga]